MNSVHMFVVDETGQQFLDTFTANTPENIAAFRRHVASCKNYWRTPAYRAKVNSSRWPCGSVEIKIVEYDDKSAPK